MNFSLSLSLLCPVHCTCDFDEPEIEKPLKEAGGRRKEEGGRRKEEGGRRKESSCASNHVRNHDASRKQHFVRYFFYYGVCKSDLIRHPASYSVKRDLIQCQKRPNGVKSELIRHPASFTRARATGAPTNTMQYSYVLPIY